MTALLPGIIAGAWRITRDGDAAAAAIYRRHYSCHRYADGRRDDRRYRNRNLVCGPGEKMLLLAEGPALFIWRKFIDDSGQVGVNCAAFRNEGRMLSSALIREACSLAWQRWPGERLYTYVDGRAVKSSNPGCCFRKAGWRRCGQTKGGLLVFELRPEIGGQP